MARRDALDLEVLGGVAGQFQDLGRQVLEDRRRVDGGRGADAARRRRRRLEQPVDATNWKLQAGARRSRDTFNQ